MDTQEIYVLDKRLRLHHTEKGFKTSLDSVFLGAACPARPGEHILDMGCGVGGAGLCVLIRVDGVRLTGVDIQADHIELAKRNAVVNNFHEQCEFICRNIIDYKNDNAFDHVICNPPYLEAGAHLRSPHEEKAKAMGHEEKHISVGEWIDVAYDAVKSNGTLTMIHRADKTDKIIQGLGKRFGAVEIIPLWPREGEDAKRVIIRAVKHRRSPAILRCGIPLHQSDGSYTAQAEDILRHAKEI